MSEPRITLTIEPDGVRADEYVIAVAVDGVERERSTWRTLEAATSHAAALVGRFFRQVYR